jgi:hypothetical protein
MSSKGILVGIGLSALLVTLGACGQRSRSAGASKNGSTAQGENAAAGDEVMACTDATGQFSLIDGLMTADAPTMNGYFLPHGSAPPAPPPNTDVAPTCDAPLAMPPVAPATDFHYQAYTFANDGDAASCVSVTFDMGFITEGPPIEFVKGVETLAYRDSFDPSDLTKNYLASFRGLQYGDGTSAPIDACCSTATGIWAKFSFEVPAHTKFVVVVSGEEAPRAEVPADRSVLYFPYSLGVTNCNGHSEDGGGGGTTEPDAGTTSDDGGGTGKTW